MPESARRLRIAVVGCGVAGLTAAWLLRRRHEVFLYEKNDYVGGHTRTLEVPDGPDAGTPVDTGFIVMNHRNYPIFSRVLEDLGVPLAPSSMSFGYFDRETGYGYAGEGLRGLFPTASCLADRSHWSFVRGLARFARVGHRDLLSGALSGKTLGEYLEERRYGEPFAQRYLYPMGAAIWSSPVHEVRRFPAEAYLRFFENHGLLRLVNRPRWLHVRGGSRTYVRAMLRDLPHPPELTAGSIAIRRRGDRVILLRAGGAVEYDHVVIGAPADQALRLLADPAPDEVERLAPWRYQDNEVVLHTCADLVPSSPRLRASWNFVRAAGDAPDRPVCVTYDMCRLQNLRTRRDYFVTLNPGLPIPESAVIDRTTLAHPLYSFESLATQTKLKAMNGRRNTWFCGSYFGYGFHEDAVRSAADVARAFGIET